MTKKLLMFTCGMLAFFGAQAQTKSTGSIALGSNMTATLELNNTTTTATLTLTGPSDRWFALQFGSFTGSQGMASGKDMVYFNGTTLVDGRMNGLGAFPATDTSNDWMVTTNTISGSTRTIVASRDFDTGDANDYDFVYSSSSIDFAWARGFNASYSMSNHGGSNRGYSLNNSMSVLGTEQFQKESIKIYPNPAAEQLNIQTDAHISSVKVYTLSGSLVKEINTPVAQQISLTNMRKGIYFVEVTTNSNTFYKKIIKN